jgi:predicted DNA-binding protein YlxM (UPF0122 family)
MLNSGNLLKTGAASIHTIPEEYSKFGEKNMEYKITYEITEIIELYEVNEIFIYDCIEREWIIPIDINKKLLDREDVARLLLIKDLKEDFGVNNESIPIILHLIDELRWSQAQFKHCIENLKK